MSRISDLTDKPPPTNSELAEKLEQVSELLRSQGADPYRSSAYARAAKAIREHTKPLWQVAAAQGIPGLEDIKFVGPSIARALWQLICGERWNLLERLLGRDVTLELFSSVPNIGPKLAQRLQDELAIESLAELEAAAWDGRLAKLPGFGEKRVRAVRESLAGRGRTQVPPEGQPSKQDSDQVLAEVPIEELLDVDDEYRRSAARNELPRIAPRNFNPTVEAWLPVLHIGRSNRHYTAMFSNTRRAHEMHTTHDWVVIYLDDHYPGALHGQWTVITSQFGKLKGKRIVRGRESECLEHYRGQLPDSSKDHR